MLLRILSALLVLVIGLVGCSRENKTATGDIGQGSGTSFADITKKAEGGDAQAQEELGLKYRFGEGTSRNADEAVKWLRKSAEQGNITAMRRLYRAGLHPNAADCNFTPDGRLILLGTNNNAQFPLNIEPGEAIKWLRKAADTGDAMSLFFLGGAYHNGQGGLVPDAKQAKLWYEKAASVGFVEADLSLAFLLLATDSPITNRAEGLVWLRKAAEKGHPDAQVLLADEYVYGEVVPKNETEARRWYEKAASQGDERAKQKLAVAVQPGGAGKERTWADVEKDMKSGAFDRVTSGNSQAEDDAFFAEMKANKAKTTDPKAAYQDGYKNGEATGKEWRSRVNAASGAAQSELLRTYQKQAASFEDNYRQVSNAYGEQSANTQSLKGFCEGLRKSFGN